MTQDLTASKRAIAKNFRGVWYDPRADKFVAEVYSLGERHFLGHFEDAEDAAAAYTAARAEMPSGGKTGIAFLAAFEAFHNSAKKDDKGRPVAGSPLVYDGQHFSLLGVTFRHSGKRTLPYYQWRGACQTCGAVYETMTPASPVAAKGITRNCPQHVTRRGPAKKVKDAAPQRGAAEDKPEWLQLAQQVADEFSLVGDTVDLSDFLRRCREIEPDAPRAFNRFVMDSENSPLIEDGDTYRIR